jgi:hypothetical protein
VESRVLHVTNLGNDEAPEIQAWRFGFRLAVTSLRTREQLPFFQRM